MIGKQRMILKIMITDLEMHQARDNQAEMIYRKIQKHLHDAIGQEPPPEQVNRIFDNVRRDKGCEKHRDIMGDSIVLIIKDLFLTEDQIQRIEKRQANEAESEKVRKDEEKRREEQAREKRRLELERERAEEQAIIDRASRLEAVSDGW